MRSIIGEIENAEARAEEIRLSAAAESREIIASARDDAERALSQLDEQERVETASALEVASKEGEAIADSMLQKMSAEADQLCVAARDKLDNAVKYLIDRVRETA